MQINQRLDIFLDNQQETEGYPSRIEGISDKQLQLAMPMAKSIPIILLPGTKFYCRFVSKDAVWEFTSKYIDKDNKTIPLWIVERPKVVENIQQRAFVRMQITLPMCVHLLTQEGQIDMNSDDIPGTAVIDVTTKNIGGGGVLFVTKKPLPLNEKIKMQLDLHQDNSLETIGEVIRLVPSSDPNLKIYFVAAKFLDISEKDRDKIIKYIFKKQIERKQKGV